MDIHPRPVDAIIIHCSCKGALFMQRCYVRKPEPWSPMPVIQAGSFCGFTIHPSVFPVDSGDLGAGTGTFLLYTRTLGIAIRFIYSKCGSLNLLHCSCPTPWNPKNRSRFSPKAWPLRLKWGLSKRENQPQFPKSCQGWYLTPSHPPHPVPSQGLHGLAPLLPSCRR